MKILFSILFVALFLNSGAQIYKALNVTRKEGLSDSNVKAICVDKLGFVWFGTEHGLNRYDGFETASYYHRADDETSLEGNFINNIYEDFNGVVWVNASGFLHKYNRQKESFKRVRPGNSSEYCIIAYEDSTYLWIKATGSEKLWLYDKLTDEFHEENLEFINSNISISEFNYSMICDIDDKHLLFAITGRGLYLFNKFEKTLELFKELPNASYRGLFRNGDDIWVGFGAGSIYKINIENRDIVVYNSTNSELVNSVILDMKKHPHTNNIWVSTDGSGIMEFNEEFQLINHFVTGPKVNQLLPANSINTVHFTKNGEVWAGTVRSGAVLLYPGNFEHFSFVDNPIAGPSSGIIVKIIEDKTGNIWLATDGGGLNKFDSDTYGFNSFSDKGLTKITGVVEFSENRLLLADYLGKLHFFDTEKKRFSDAHLHPLLQGISFGRHYRLSKDSKGNVWIWADKLMKVNPQENKKQEFAVKEYTEFFSKINRAFFSTYEDTINNLLWFGASGGIYAYNYKTERIDHSVILSSLQGNSGSAVFSICAVNESEVLFGTSRGLFVYNPTTRLTSVYWKDKIFDNTVFQSLFTEDENIWAATSEGLLKVVKDDDAREAVKYQVGSHDFRSSSLLLSNDNKVYLGTNNGFIRFMPELVTEDTSVAQVVITSFEQKGTRKGEEYKNEILTNVTEKAHTSLPFSNSLYQFHFNSFDIPFQKKINYSYLLEGFEEISHTGKSRTATYTNLSPGKYTFKVKASTATGFWTDVDTSIVFEILPPWWQTSWFRISTLVFILAFAGFIWNELLKRAKLKHLVEVEQNEQERLKEVNQMKLRFFTNISHELRTPLTLIYSPLKKIRGSNLSSDEIRNRIPGLYRNAQRMKILVDQILEFRKAEMDKLTLQLGNYDLIDFCRETIEYFDFMAKSENMNLSLEHVDDVLFIDFDRDKLSKVLFNLLSNAIKFSNKGGKIVVKVETEKKELIISVSDTGKGIAENKIGNIFERYYQAEIDSTGTGIGLALTKNLVELHGGTITVNSKIGVGSEFFVCLPITSNSLKIMEPENVLDENTELSNSDLLVNTTVPLKDGNLYSILIVEDDWELRHYLKDELGSDFEVITASNGKAGLETAIVKLPDLIISDVMMPELTGFELCQKLREDIRISHIPVILLTAKTMAENQIEGYKVGADLYVSKPFDKDVLQTQIEALLSNRQLLRNRFNNIKGIKVDEVTHSKTDEKLLEKAIGIVNVNLRNIQFDVNTFVEQLGISRTLAYGKIKAISGKSINDFILAIRLQNAANLLNETNNTISEIAIECGFSDHSYFSAVFKKNFEVSPSEYRQNQKI